MVWVREFEVQKADCGFKGKCKPEVTTECSDKKGNPMFAD
jgi:hypothetical protein